MALKKCKECGAEISSSAKKCPKCGKDLTHPVLRGVLLAILIIGVVGAAFGPSDENTNTNTVSSSTTSVVSKENYDKIEKGMTEEQVKEILGEPASTSESETPGVGTMVLKHYQEALAFKAIDIYFLDGKVYMKNWTDL